VQADKTIAIKTITVIILKNILFADILYLLSNLTMPRW